MSFPSRQWTSVARAEDGVAETGAQVPTTAQPNEFGQATFSVCLSFHLKWKYHLLLPMSSSHCKDRKNTYACLSPGVILKMLRI